jgi:hypothetical protein
MPEPVRKTSAKQPRLEGEAPECALPHVRVDWTDAELASLAKLASSEPAKPTDALIRLMKG